MNYEEERAEQVQETAQNLKYLLSILEDGIYK